MQYFIQQINIKKVRHIEDFPISLGRGSRQHLIITGKNGVGKTSLLQEIAKLFSKLINNEFAQIQQLQKNIDAYLQYIANSERNIVTYEQQIESQAKQKTELMSNEVINKGFIEQLDSNLQSYTANVINERNNIQNWQNQIDDWQNQIDDYSKSLSIEF